MLIIILIYFSVIENAQKLKAVIDNIDHSGWIALKKRYIFAQRHITNSHKGNDKNLDAIIENTLQDEERDLFELVKKCTEKTDLEIQKIISEIEDEAIKISDKEFVSICDKEILLNKFYKEYKEWRIQIFPSKLKQVICDFIEELHHSDNVLYVIDIVEGKNSIDFTNLSGGFFTRSFKIKCKLEVHRPAKLSISLDDIQLSESDRLEMEKDENFVPKPILTMKNTFEINLETHDFKYESIYLFSFLFF